MCAYSYTHTRTTQGYLHTFHAGRIELLVLLWVHHDGVVEYQVVLVRDRRALVQRLEGAGGVAAEGSDLCMCVYMHMYTYELYVVYTYIYICVSVCI